MSEVEYNRLLESVRMAIEPASLEELMADLPVFIRQSHAERDQAAHGAVVLRQDTSWAL